MSIASELQTLNDKILDAYDAVNDKGGTIPSAKNMANLVTAIGTITTGSSTTVTPLSVTTNGTYTAPTGTAYSPVTVNVSGSPTVACGIVTASADGVVNVEHNLGQLPTVWGIRPTGAYSGSYARYEALEKIRYYLTNGNVEQVDIYANAAITSWNTASIGNSRMYRQQLTSSVVRPNTDTQFDSTITDIPANKKYIGLRFYTTSTLSAFLLTGREYFWFAMITNQTP